MFWDSSALIPLILREAISASLTERLTHEESITILCGQLRRHREDRFHRLREPLSSGFSLYQIRSMCHNRW